ncbi:MAG TPA: hypothetical protein VM470_04780 [Acidimicrobiia bacterium]|nr:hypothetical protein [Acidimicrobiia bacterium]
MTGHRALLVFAWMILLASCAGGGGDVTTTLAETTTTVATTMPAATTAPTTTTIATTTTGSAATCPEAADPPDGWRFLQTSLWVFYHPPDWEDLTVSAPPQTAGTHFDDVTIANAGVDPDETLVSFVMVSPDRSNGLILTRLDGVTSPLEEIYQRAEDRYEESADFEEMITPAVIDCLGGEAAMHVGFMSAGSYQQSWFALHGDTLFHADFFGLTPEDSSVNAQLFSTFEWIEEASTEHRGEAFVEMAMANTIDASVGAPDPSWYTDSFTTSDTAIYAIFRLEPGLSGLIEAVWTYEGEQQVLSHEFFYEEDDSWGYMGMTAPSGGFTPGDYQVELTLDGDVAAIVLDFTIVEG